MLALNATDPDMPVGADVRALADHQSARHPVS
jgi:hypothetical protein